MNRKTRKVIRFGMPHPKSYIGMLYIQHIEGGIGLIQLESYYK